MKILIKFIFEIKILFIIYDVNFNDINNFIKKIKNL